MIIMILCYTEKLIFRVLYECLLINVEMINRVISYSTAIVPMKVVVSLVLFQVVWHALCFPFV